jgi:sigma-B regulation protein RsbU (phosphoserine phosphatase)
MKKLSLFIITILITLISLWLIGVFYPKVHPFGAIGFTEDKTTIKEKAINLSETLGFETKDYILDLELRYNNQLIRQIHDKNGLEEGNKIMREQVPGYYWDLKWQEQGLKIVFSGSEDTSENQEKNKDSAMIKDIDLQYDTHGNLILINIPVADTLKAGALTLEEAKNLVIDFASRHAQNVKQGLKIQSEKGSDQNPSVNIHQSDVDQAAESNQNTSYDFRWQIKDSEKNDIEIKATVTGIKISNFETTYVIGESFKDSSSDFIEGILNVLLMLTVIALVVIFAFKKSRTYELRFRLAFMLGGLLAVLNALEFYLMVSRAAGWQIFMVSVVVPLFFGGIFIIAWAVSESVGRETWNEKFLAIDLIMKGHLLHSKIGQGIFRGLAIGSGALAVLLFLTWISSQVLSVSAFTMDDYIRNIFASANSGLILVSHSFWSNLFIVTVYFILIISLLYQKIHRTNITLYLASLPMAIVLVENIQPLSLGLFLKATTAIILVWGFLRFDIFTTFIALMTFRILNMGFAFIPASDVDFANSLLFLILLAGIMVIYAAVSVMTKDRVIDPKDIESGLAKYINERQRLEQELKIARDVQTSFLPQHIPIIKGLDIASQCIPALEVGGDYYDFIKLGPHKIGIAIGDVSGKGTRAAFYMTLVKGFLKALVQGYDDPAEILKKLNILFFENAKRDAFISMIYGVFDLKMRKLTLARSGHNPVMLLRQNVLDIDIIKTEGLALGLEKGELFDKMMQETELPLNSGDIYILYTDGLTEAMNKNQEEFGEDRLKEAIKKYADQKAEQIVDNVLQDVNKFSRGAKQHDDMSMVIIKVI